MLPALLTILAPVLVAVLALRRLRGRRLQLRAVRSRFRATLDSCESERSRLEALEGGARVASLAPAPAGRKPSQAETEFVSLRESLRQVEESLLQGEGEWHLGQYDHVASRLSNLWAQLDTLAGAIDRLEQELADLQPQVPAGAARELLAARAAEEQAARTPQESEIRARVEREVPRLLARARNITALGGTWSEKRLSAAEAASAEATSALERGDLVGADRLSRLSRALSGSMVRLCEAGLVLAPAPSRGLWPAVAAACAEARVPARQGVIWTLSAMALAGATGHWLGSRLSTPSTEVLTTSGNLALHRPARASHAVDLAHTAGKAVDGDLTTTWQSGASLADAQALWIDLGKRRPIAKVLVLPRAAPAGFCTWEADLSDDGWIWHTAGAAGSSCGPTGSRWGTLEIKAGSLARFVRVRPIGWGRSGVSIAEVRVFSPSRLLKE